MEGLKAISTITLRTGNKIPMIGYGTYQLNGDDCVKGTEWAIKAGYTHIDTASVYKNEVEINKALKELKIPRQKLYITSKIGPAQQGYNNAREGVQQILKKLQINYLDLILIHWPGTSMQKANSNKNPQIRLETWKAFIQLKNQGKVRDIGVSNFLTHHLKHLFENTKQFPSVNQIQLHPFLWEESTIQFCRKNNIAIEAYSPLARSDPCLFENETMLSLSKKYKKTVAQITLRWCLQHGFIILPKSKSLNRIKENIDIYDFELQKNDMETIDGLRKQKQVRTCWDPNTVIY